VVRARRWLLDPDGHPSDTYYAPGAAVELERVLAEFRADVVIVERLWLHRYIPHARRFATRVVLDAHNVEAELSRQLAAAEPSEATGSRRIRETLAERTAAIEGAATSAVDQIWVCSEQDRRVVEARYRPRVGVEVVPNGVEVASYTGVGAAAHRAVSAPAPAALVFPAMFTYAPNATAARFLIEELLPRLPSTACRLVLVGSMPTPAMLDAARRDERIVVTGAVPDVRPFLQEATAVVVPLFEGSGTRFKILEAFAARVPVITTPVGADGLDVVDGTHVLLARTAAEFAAAVERIRTEPALVARLTRHGHELVSRRYSWEAASDCIAAALARLAPGNGRP
jgi:glycosyltransferase involved in cell wall biosynthesis